MSNNVTRSRLIQAWFAAVILVAVAGVVLGVSLRVSTGALLLALSVVPPAIVLALWPRVQSPSAADVLYRGDRRD